jgi:hypothetical protein
VIVRAMKSVTFLSACGDELPGNDASRDSRCKVSFDCNSNVTHEARFDPGAGRRHTVET